MMMSKFLPFYPRKIAYLGAAALAGGAILGGGFLWFLRSSPPVSFMEEKKKEAEVLSSPIVSLGLNRTPPLISLPKISQELIFLSDAPRPDEISLDSSLFVKLKKTGQTKQVVLPARLNLEFGEGEKLVFSEKDSGFWIEIASSFPKKIEGKVCVENPFSQRIETEAFSASFQEPPIQGAQEFTEGSSFRALSEAKWWGPDKLREKYFDREVCQRIEIGGASNAQMMSLREGEWLIWDRGEWMKGTLDKGAQKPIARIKGVQGKSLILEGWEGRQYVHLALSQQTSSMKVKGEDLFNSIRVRSAQQMSCMLEKQWLILKAGDWILKTEGRWKVLKKQEERDLCREGKMSGEVFVFEKIESKAGQKYIQGQFFSSDRSQMLAIELAVPVHNLQKGKNEADARKGSAHR